MSHGPNTARERLAVFEYIEDHSHVVKGEEPGQPGISTRPEAVTSGNQLAFLCWECGDYRTIDSLHAEANAGMTDKALRKEAGLSVEDDEL